MKKKNILPIAVCMLSASLFAQTEKFDIASFIPPGGWERNEQNGTLSFINSKTANGLTSFCQIILYPAGNSSGNADKDFKTSWKNLVTIGIKSKAKPTVQSEKTPDGWTIVTGSANVTFQGMSYKTIVANISGHGKSMPIQINAAGGDYAAELDNFFNGLELDSKATLAVNKQKDVTNNDQKTTGRKITMSDYYITIPQGWTSQNKGDHLFIQNPQSGCNIRILAPQASSGNLETDAKAVFDLMYQGWQYQKRGEQQYTLTKGILQKGLEYFMMEAPMSKLSADGSRYDGFEEGGAMVVKAGAQIVIVSIRHNTSLMGHNDCIRKYETMRMFFNSFAIKNVPLTKPSENAVERIIGSWSMIEAGAAGEYVFAANGNYAFYGAIGTTSTSKNYNYEQLHIKTYGFQGDGSYSISEDLLTLKNRHRNNEENIRFRFEKVNYGGTGWKDRIWMLTRTAYGEKEVVYDKR